MVPIISLLLILCVSLIVTRVASVALEHTGLSRDAARFQARSAFTGVGFTTSEAESVVTGPVRRRIIMSLMLVGNVGIVSAMAASLLSAIDLRTQEGVGLLVALLVGGVATLCAISASRTIDRQMCRWISWAIERWTEIDAQDYARLLHLRDEYGVARFRVAEGTWIADRRLDEVRLPNEGILVLGIECPDGNFMGAPGRDVGIRAGDELVVYGPATGIRELEQRAAGEEGDRCHRAASTAHAGRTLGERQVAGR